MYILSNRSVLAALVLAVAGGCASGPSIEGAYRLVRRELPDGRVQKPPHVVGHHTFTRTHRHTTVAWKDAGGRWYTQSYVAVYRINSDRYVEAPVYLTINDQIGGRPPKNSIGGDPGESPVTVSGGTISFQAPAAFERVFNLQFEFDEGGFRAIGPGVFVDHWEKTN